MRTGARYEAWAIPSERDRLDHVNAAPAICVARAAVGSPPVCFGVQHYKPRSGVILVQKRSLFRVQSGVFAFEAGRSARCTACSEELYWWCNAARTMCVDVLLVPSARSGVRHTARRRLFILRFGRSYFF